MKIVGFHSGHDSAYSILDNGVPVIHNELERFNRRKNSVSNSIQFFLDNEKNIGDIKHMTTHRTGGMVDNDYMKSFNKCQSIIEKNGGKLYIVGHHQSHAANAFFTSNFNEALIMTIDGSGIDNIDESLHNKLHIDVAPGTVPESGPPAADGYITCTTFWYGTDNRIDLLRMIGRGKVNIGFYWTNCTRKIFGLGTWRDQMGDQAGTVMGMAALGDSNKYILHFKNLSDLRTGDDWGPVDIDFLIEEAEKSEQNKFDIAAALQKETEDAVKGMLTPFIEKYKPKNLCLSGGVSLNCVIAGKMLDWYPGINIFCDPIPYDAGLSLGSSRYVWHHILGNSKIYNNPSNWNPYLGYTYSEKEIWFEIEKHLISKSNYKIVNDDDVIDLLCEKNIISVFGGGSESGRRALGNRSILADPRHSEIKDIVNEKVKHRQWFRPFAPSILREDVKDWFAHDIGSPYMSFALSFKDGMAEKVPAVVHFDDTARLQTVKKEDNEWYYNFIKKFKDKTGIPMVLNTSFNDREPIVETPGNAIDCFIRTNIDYLYFRDYGILVSK